MHMAWLRLYSCISAVTLWRNAHGAVLLMSSYGTGFMLWLNAAAIDLARHGASCALLQASDGKFEQLGALVYAA